MLRPSRPLLATLVVAFALGIVEHLPAVQPAIGHARDTDRIIDHGRDRAADMRAMAEEITLAVAVVPVFLDRISQIGMSGIDTAVEHGDMNPPRTRSLRYRAVKISASTAGRIAQIEST